MNSAHYPCPCCGFLTRVEQNFGTFDICPVCYWEDDPIQGCDASASGGANRISLAEARTNYRNYGASSLEFVSIVRDPLSDEIPKQLSE